MCEGHSGNHGRHRGIRQPLWASAQALAAQRQQTHTVWAARGRGRGRVGAWQRGGIAEATCQGLRSEGRKAEAECCQGPGRLLRARTARHGAQPRDTVSPGAAGALLLGALEVLTPSLPLKIRPPRPHPHSPPRRPWSRMGVGLAHPSSSCHLPPKSPPHTHRRLQLGVETPRR